MRKKHIRRNIVLFLVTALTVSMITTGIWAVSQQNDGGVYIGADCTTDKTAVAGIDYIMKKYPGGKEYPGLGQCWGYAEEVSGILAAERSVKYYVGLKFNKTNFRKYCLKVKAGTHLRLSREKNFNAGKGHSITLFKVTDNLVCWADNNYSWDNTVAYRYGTVDDFIWTYDNYGYINMIAKTTKYKSDTVPKAVSSVDYAEQKVDVYWTSVTGALEYTVYRSTSRDGKYYIAGKTKECSFTYNNAPIGKTTYFKVKARTSSDSVFSNIAYRTMRLDIPNISAMRSPITGGIELSWSPVKYADRYRVYRYSEDLEKYVWIKTTTRCTFADVKATNPECGYTYVVRAIYDANSKGNSILSEPASV